jgi:phosphoglycerate dehydrogenase-like enzyme
MAEPTPLILSLGTIHAVARDILTPHCKVVEVDPLGPDNVPRQLQTAAGLVVRADSRVTAAHLNAARQLQVIGRTGAGIDNVDLAAATAAGIPVVYAPAMNVTAVAEMTIGLFLLLGRRVPELGVCLRAGDWKSRDSAPGRELSGSTVGIVGYGRIGRAVAERCASMGCTVQAYDPYVSGLPGKAGVPMVALEELLASSDFISLHAPLTKETDGLLCRERIERIKPGAVVVNVARGGLTPDLDALHAALESGRIIGLGLDVFPAEPPDTWHPLFAHPRCIATPHVAGMSEQSLDAIFTSVAEDMLAVLRGSMPRHVVNPEACVPRAGDSKRTSKPAGKEST